MNPKTLVRKLVLTNRKLLTEDYVDQASERIADRLLHWLQNQSQIRTIHTFLPIRANREVNTWILLRSLQSNGYRTVTSCTDFVAQTMEHFLVDQDTQYEEDSYGIPSPQGAQKIDLRDLDLILVPALVLDKLGGRIGYGKGYYDKFLNQTKPQVRKVGLNLTSTLDHCGYLESHDKKVDWIITPDQVINCSESK